MNRREFVAAGAALAAGAVGRAAAEPPAAPPSGLGMLLYSYGIRARAERAAGFAEPAKFLEFCRSRGAAGVQLPLGVRTEAEAAAIRRAADRVGMTVEGIVRPPGSDREAERFAAELATAKACGAEVLRTVMLGGRRYEEFSKADDYPAFARRAEESLRRAEPLAAKAKVTLAVENHKDFRTDELIDLLRRLSSERLGVCVDTGNNLALLEDPAATVAALAPLARTVHLKDIGLEDAPDGFRMTEVPLGRGVFDLPAMVAALRKGNPKVRFHLEMITRDPLSIPCLTDKYWATLERVPGRDLARTLALVRKAAGKEPLPRFTGRTPEQQAEFEDRNVRESLAFAARTRLLAV